MNSKMLHTTFPPGVSLQMDDNRKGSIKDFLDSRYYIKADENLVKDAKYFSEASFSLQDDQYASGGTPPQGFLLDPVSRKGTSRSDFGLAPCGGASKGQARLLADPGQKTEVQWLIKDPVEGGHCQIRLSRSEEDDPNSFESLHVEGNGYDSRTGKFKCGDPHKTVETATVKLPYETSCPHWTLQWVYEAPGYGKLYQCADISIVDPDNREDCEGKCQNEGIWENRKCYWVAGFSGEFCEIEGKAPKDEEISGENEAGENGETTEFAEQDGTPETEAKSGHGFFWYYFWGLLLALLLAAIICALLWYFLKPILNPLLFGKIELDDEKESLKEDRNPPRGNDKGKNKEEEKKKEDQLKEERKRQQEDKKKEDRKKEEAKKKEADKKKKDPKKSKEKKKSKDKNSKSKSKSSKSKDKKKKDSKPSSKSKKKDKKEPA